MSTIADGLKSSVGMITSVVAAITIGYGVVVKAGWVIGRAEATTMDQVLEQKILSTLAQAVAQEETARRDADLEFQLDLALQRLQFLLAIDKRDEAQEAEVEQIKRKIERLEAKLEGDA